jgi:hypothetical protein
MSAELVLRQKDYFEDGSFVEMKVWRVPEPVPPSVHRYKYSLVYIVEGRRVLGYDNERGKGDHRHAGDSEEAVRFDSMAALVEQFIDEVRLIRGDGK